MKTKGGQGSSRQWWHSPRAIPGAQTCISHEPKAWPSLPWWCCPLNAQIPFPTASSPWQDLLVPWVGEEHLLWANIPVPTAVPLHGVSPSRHALSVPVTKPLRKVDGRSRACVPPATLPSPQWPLLPLGQGKPQSYVHTSASHAAFSSPGC